MISAPLEESAKPNRASIISKCNPILADVSIWMVDDQKQSNNENSLRVTWAASSRERG
jgi:hypothetical protein